MKILGLIGCLLLLVLTSERGNCAVKVIKKEVYKDGGTRCVEYKKESQLIVCCIDHREKVGTGKVFIGGYPEKDDARVASMKEMKTVYEDLSQLPENEQRKYYLKDFTKKLLEKINNKLTREAN